MFDDITQDDLVVAFFPCIYFCEKSMTAFTYRCFNYRCLDKPSMILKILDRERERHKFYEILLKLVGICERMKLRLVIENPYTQPHYLHNNFLKAPSVIDKDRTRRGDKVRKPTQFWFFNCEPEQGFTQQQTREREILKIESMKGGKKAGLCSEERSMISPDYARNWICDFILGKVQQDIDPVLDFGA